MLPTVRRPDQGRENQLMLRLKGKIAPGVDDEEIAVRRAGDFAVGFVDDCPALTPGVFNRGDVSVNNNAPILRSLCGGAAGKDRVQHLPCLSSNVKKISSVNN